MTRQQMYRQLEKLHSQVDWTNRQSIHQYNEKAREYRRMVAEEEERERGENK